MKVLFIVIGVVVIFGILISSGGLAGAICIDRVGCVHTEGGGLTIDQNQPVSVSTNRP
jgi:hypothetical protein